MSSPSLVEVVRRRVSAAPERLAYTFLSSGETEAKRLTYGELDFEARAIGAQLQEAGGEGERALLLYPPGLEFVTAFLGCLYAGTVAVPAYPPRAERGQPRLRSIASDASARLVLTTAGLAARAATLVEQVPELANAVWLATDVPAAGAAGAWREPAVGPESLAFLQYTSGSTADPKGVRVTHGNLVHNEEMIRAGFGQSESSVIVGWLPLYHDMGLIGNVLQPLYVGGTCVLMSPLAFLQRPLRWLAAISRYRATTSGGPNFAYDLAARKVSPAERESLDLSSWRVAFNGSEPVRAETLERFAAAFAPCGFDRRAFYPCYGLAEGTLFVSGGLPDAPPVVAAVNAAALEHGEVEPCGEAESAARSLVGCGHPWLGQRLLIVDPETGVPRPPRRVGEIWVAGASVADGYWNRPDETRGSFGAAAAGEEGAFLRTGDLGFLADGELFVTGRLKDLVILRGRNLYPHDLELTAERSHPSLRPGCSAAFSVDAEGEERLVLVLELDRGAETDVEGIAAAVRQAVAGEHEAQVREVVLLPAGALPKTSSGKIRRSACRELYRTDRLPAVGRSRLGGEDEAATEGASSLLDLMARLLRVPASALDPDRPLTALGIDSLAAVELQHGLQSELGVSVDLAEILAGPTLRQMGEELASRRADPQRAVQRMLAPADAPAGEQPLSQGQRALWFLQRLEPASAAYNIVAAARVRPALDAAALARAAAVLTRRHEALRFSFRATESGPVQEARADRGAELAFEDASAWSEERLRSRLQEVAYRPFDLERDPLLRLHLFHLSSGAAVVLLAVHHIVADLWSLGVMVDELGRIYAGEERLLPPLPARHADYVAWQQRLLAGEEGERLWDYWRERLAGELPPSAVPGDRPRPALQSFRGAARSLRLGPDLAERLGRLGSERRATLFTTLLAGFKALLCRLSGQNDLLVGTPTAGRSAAELAGLVGYFVNPVAVRSQLAGDLPGDAALERVREAVLGAFRHQDYPFPLLVERLRPERDPGRSPIFQVLFVLQRSHLAGARDLAAFALGTGGATVGFGRHTLEALPLEQRAAQLDLELMAAQTGRGIELALVYNTDLFDATTAERFLGHLAALLAGLAEDPGRRIADLPLLTAPERHQLLREWNAAAVSFPLDRPFHEHFAERATASPEAPAAACRGEVWSYGRLAARAGRLARALVADGVGTEEPVAVWAERGLELLAAMIGIFAAGGVYVPLNPDHPGHRLAQAVAGSGSRRVLVSDACLAACRTALAGPGEPRILPLADLLSAERPEGIALPRVLPGQLAYLLFTSGSTGAPKGVMIEHRGMLNHLAAKLRDLGLGAADCVAQTAAQSFDISIWQLLAPLLAGGRVEILPDAVVRDPAQLLAEVESRGIGVLEIVPSQLAAVLDQVAEEPGAGRGLAALRWLIPTGEALPPELCRRWFASFPGVPLVNAYGPTECSDDVTHHLLSEPPPPGRARIPIGRPVANLRVHVLDAGLSAVPIGVPGELFAGGAGVGRGYAGDARRTAEAFIPDPLGEVPGGRLYRTGDWGLHQAGGALDFLGRRDDQVKIRGFRIELAEVEAALAACPGVREAVVLAREDRRGELRLAAWWTPAAGEERPDETALRERLRGSLPEAMIPAVFLRLEDLPLTPHGKVDRKALPAPLWELADRGGEPAGPRDEIEELLAGIFDEVLGRERIGVDEDFFEAGGHSLLATQVMARVRGALGLEVPLQALFLKPTVAGLAVRVRELLAAAAGPAVAELPLVPLPQGSGPFLLSFAQQRLWFLQQLSPESPAYNMPGAVRLRGPLSPAALAASLAAVVARHGSLRTTFREVAGDPFQEVAPSLVPALPCVDLSALPAARSEACAGRLAAEESRRPFDLSRGPLLRAHLLRLAAADHLLVLTLHHVVSDGWSQGVLVREVSACYAAFAQGRAPDLPPLPVQYVDFAHWQRRWLADGVLDAQLAYWREELAGEQAPLALPTDRPRPPRQTYRGRRRAVALPADLSLRLRRLSRRERVTPFMAILSCFGALLGRLSAAADLRIGTPIANRRRVELEGLIGFFVNTMVLRVRLVDGLPLRELLARVRETALGAYANQDIPFERLVEELEPERDLARSPLFQTMLILQNAPAVPLRLPGLDLAVGELDNGTAKFDLLLSLEETAGGLAGFWEYDADLFDPPAVERLSHHLLRLVEGAVEDPGTPVAELPLLTASEHAALLAEWNDTRADLGPAATVHHLFAEQARRTPRAVAVTAGGSELSYAELNARANRLANHLRRLGVRPESLVGLCVERSCEMVVALLGVLKAGGAYVPMDPLHPRQRLAWLLEDARPAVVLTESPLLAILPEHGAPVVLLDEGFAGESSEPPRVEVPPQALAYTIFTSGSTGRPKGVEITHAAWVNFLRSMADRPGLGSGDVLLAVTTLSFDIAGLELLLPLTRGARVVLASREVAADGARLAEEIARSGATVMQATPATWRLLLEAGWEGLPGFTALCGGETLPRELAQLLLSRTGALWNLYGPTETTIWSALHAVRGAARVPVGRPIANTSIHVVDGAGRPVPPGVAGELRIGGAGLARGYRGRPDLTAERFVPDPFGDPPGGRLYCTGDVASRLPDGALELLGRGDQQVKVRGFRIELGEIEAALEAHPAVAQAVVAARAAGGEREEGGDRRLVAYLVAGGGTVDLGDLRRWLRGRLPEYMLPTAFVVLDALPLTPNRKVDRRALPDPVPAAADTAGAAAPSDPLAELVAGTFAQVLELPAVGVRDNFFERGGHSLLATRVISRLNSALAATLPLHALFENPTAESLARVLGSSRRPPLAVPPLVRIPRGQPPAASFAQERLWVMSHLLPDSPVYNVFQGLSITGPLDEAVLARCFDEVVRRHEVLRTTFATTAQGLPIQVIAPPAPAGLPRVDLSGLPAAVREGEASRLALGEARRPFNLRSAPLFRTCPVLLDEGSRQLLLTIHHIVCDDWSIGLLVREVAVLYAAFARNEPSPLPELPVQYADFADWQHRWLTGEVLAAEVAHWRQRLAGELPVLALPTDRKRPAVQRFRGAVETIALPEPLLADLRRLAVREGVTLFMALLAGFATVLHRCSGQDDLVIGVPVAGRTRVETEGLIGFFVNVLPLRIDLAGRPGYRGLLARLRAVALEAYDHQDLPFERLVEALQPKRDLSHAAIRQVGFALQEAALRPVELSGGAVARPLEIDPGVARLDLTLFLVPAEEGLRAACELNTDLFDRATIARLLGSFRSVLEDLAGGVERPLLELPPLLAPAEREQARAEPPETDLTAGQLLFWFAHRLGGEELYFDRATALFDLPGGLDPDHFEKAFHALLATCELLRSRVREAGGVPRRTVAAGVPVPLERVDLAREPDPETALRGWLAQRSRRKLDLGEAVYDTALVRMAPGRFVWYWSLHHIVADAWTLELLARQLSRLYALSLAGELVQARPMPSYGAVIAEEREARRSGRWERARLYWERKLAQPAPANAFYRRMGVPQTTRTERLSRELGVEASDTVRGAASRLGAFSNSVVFAAVLFAHLHRLGGERRLRLGTPFSNRPERFKETPGLMMNPCPLQIEIAPEETFATLVRKVQRETVETARHQSFPVRNPPEDPVYDVYFNYQTVAFRELCGLPVRFELLHSGRSNDNLDLQVSDFAGSGSFRCDFDFNQGAFDAGAGERTVGHHLILLAAFLADSSLPLRDAPLLSAAERDELVFAFNATTADYPRGLCLHHLIEAQIERTPNVVAVVAEEGELSYRDLGERAGRLAGFLNAAGVGPDTLVGVAMDRSLDLAVALLGILKAGGGAVPIDPGYPAERVAYMLTDSRVAVLLTQSHLERLLPAGVSPRVVRLDADWPAIAQHTPAAAFPAAGESGLAYAIYTSGSTGKPKGAMVTHAGICNRLLWMQEAYGLTAGDRVLQKTPLSFDVSVWELYWPLITGARLVMARPSGHQDPAYLAAVIRREEITTLHFVPSMLQVFLEQPGLDQCRSLVRVIASGEALPDALRIRFHERLRAELHNLYGPTEASVDVTAWRCERESDLPFVPIGKPIANTWIHLLDAGLNLVPCGIPGELHIGGVSLARGYLARPELTAERFVPDPYGGVAGGRLYKTGDLARFLWDGSIEFLGRIDHQVKLRGFRIELGEIESALVQFPGVREAVVLAREDRPGDRRLVAYFIPEPGWGPSPVQLRGYLQSRLPEHMVPAFVVALEAMPLNPSGKVDRRALPPPAPAAETSSRVPATPLEFLIAGVCAEVLGVESVAVDANFFDLGGNSLMATQVVTMLQEVLPIELDLRKVFEGPTVARLAGVIEESRATLSETERRVMAEILAEVEAGSGENLAGGTAPGS